MVGASLVCGEDNHGNFELEDAPSETFSPQAMTIWKRLRAVEKAIFLKVLKSEAECV